MRSAHESPARPESRATCAPAPVVLVPGFGHAENAWMLVSRHLERAGFEHVVTVPPPPPSADLPDQAEHLARQVEAVRARTGAERVHLVGHNVGGIVCRYYVQLLGGHRYVDTVVTIASPHGGTDAHHAFGPAATQVRRDSAVVRRLHESVRPLSTRWISFCSERDLFVEPAESARLDEPPLRSTNVVVSEHAHLSLTIPPSVCRSIAHQLAAAEGVPGYGSVVAPFRRPAPPAPSPDAVERSRRAHPSSWHPPMRVVSLTGQEERLR